MKGSLKTIIINTEIITGPCPQPYSTWPMDTTIYRTCHPSWAQESNHWGRVMAPMFPMNPKHMVEVHMPQISTRYKNFHLQGLLPLLPQWPCVTPQSLRVHMSMPKALSCTPILSEKPAVCLLQLLARLYHSPITSNKLANHLVNLAPCLIHRWDWSDPPSRPSRLTTISDQTVLIPGNITRNQIKFYFLL